MSEEYGVVWQDDEEHFHVKYRDQEIVLDDVYDLILMINTVIMSVSMKMMDMMDDELLKATWEKFGDVNRN